MQSEFNSEFANNYKFMMFKGSGVSFLKEINYLSS